MSNEFVARSVVAVPVEEAFAWHMRPGALERLTPPWQHVSVVERTGGVADGGRVVLRVPAGPFKLTWTAQHGACLPNRRFEDEQVRGPFKAWRHVHGFEPTEDHSGAVLEDRIDYTLPLGSAGSLVAGRAVARTLERTFAYRHAVVRGDLERHHAWGERSWSIGVTGASGFVGSALAPFLTAAGHRVTRLVRGPGRDGIAWDPERGTIDGARLEGLDAVVHLAGHNIAAGRWTRARKRSILESRAKGTRLLAETLAKLDKPPRVLVSISAIGFYGDRGDAVVDESSAPGKGFLASVCREWESATEPARAHGIRVVTPRLGIVLGAAGGALARMLTPFLLGAGGPVGSGRQWMSWISLDDVLGVIGAALFDDRLQGAVNAVAPGAVDNREFSRVLGRVLRRPAFLPLPALAVRLLFGEMGRELLLASQRVRPAALDAAGFRFRHPDLESALRFELGRLQGAPLVAPARLETVRA
ncbi:MAG TPA: TIGR01777 family oxidoreductase [Planctomycetota bacterium]|nr:TIGR01777 family oxidoreductase [Planctomycetota bacterium]